MKVFSAKIVFSLIRESFLPQKFPAIRYHMDMRGGWNSAPLHKFSNTQVDHFSACTFTDGLLHVHLMSHT